MHMLDDGHSIRIMSYNILADLLVCCWAHNTIYTQISSSASIALLMKLLMISLGMSHVGGYELHGRLDSASSAGSRACR